jgi:hypothetical protein
MERNRILIIRVLTMTAILGLMFAMHGKDPFRGTGMVRIEAAGTAAGRHLGNEDERYGLAYANVPAIPLPKDRFNDGSPVVVIIVGGDGDAPGFIIVMNRGLSRSAATGGFPGPAPFQCGGRPVAVAADY